MPFRLNIHKQHIKMRIMQIMFDPKKSVADDVKITVTLSLLIHFTHFILIREDRGIYANEIGFHFSFCE